MARLRPVPLLLGLLAMAATLPAFQVTGCSVPEAPPGEPGGPPSCRAAAHPLAVPLLLVAGVGALGLAAGPVAVGAAAGAVLLVLGVMLVFSLGYLAFGAGAALLAGAWLARPPRAPASPP